MTQAIIQWDDAQRQWTDDDALQWQPQNVLINTGTVTMTQNTAVHEVEPAIIMLSLALSLQAMKNEIEKLPAALDMSLTGQQLVVENEVLMSVLSITGTLKTILLEIDHRVANSLSLISTQQSIIKEIETFTDKLAMTLVLNNVIAETSFAAPPFSLSVLQNNIIKEIDIAINKISLALTQKDATHEIELSTALLALALVQKTISVETELTPSALITALVQGSISTEVEIYTDTAAMLAGLKEPVLNIDCMVFIHDALDLALTQETPTLYIRRNPDMPFDRMLVVGYVDRRIYVYEELREVRIIQDNKTIAVFRQDTNTQQHKAGRTVDTSPETRTQNIGARHDSRNILYENRTAEGALQERLITVSAEQRTVYARSETRKLVVFACSRKSKEYLETRLTVPGAKNKEYEVLQDDRTMEAN